MGLIDRVHDRHVHGRRVRVLCEHLAALVPAGASVLDVGCGDGLLARLLLDRRPDLDVRGIDVLVRPGTHVPVAPFDGRTIPEADGGVDVVLFVDVLHHTDDPTVLLREAARVARRAVVLKDHTRDGLLAGPTLRFMDDVGNARHGVALPHNYWPRRRWHEAFAALGLSVVAWRDDLGLYPRPADWVFGRSLHFVARLEPSARAAALADAPQELARP
ncbi:MAG TPA: methyltransferase domain-containing protein [Isosphaeraceae bacterium]|jgi:SAM-dependent methyltransferase|nr:methyltransferase domain-containing protein [Isosphaeraceae bacterium]